MPNVSHNGTRIYYQFEGAGEPLVLHHGLSDSLWGLRALGYVDYSFAGLDHFTLYWRSDLVTELALPYFDQQRQGYVSR